MGISETRALNIAPVSMPAADLNWRSLCAARSTAGTAGYFFETQASLERQGDDRLVLLREQVGGETVLHSLRVDERTSGGLGRALSTHPFAKKKKEEDAVYFRSVGIGVRHRSVDDQRKFLGLTIVNGRSRHYVTFEISEEDFAAFKAVYEGWRARWERSRTGALKVTLPPHHLGKPVQALLARMLQFVLQWCATAGIPCVTPVFRFQWNHAFTRV